MKINKTIKKLRYKSSVGFIIVLITHKIYVFFKYRLHSDRYYISRDFKAAFGYDLDLARPKTMNEKIHWNKLNYRNPLIGKCADKFEVRQYVAKIIGDKYLIPLVFHTQDYREVKSENLPDYPIVIKANHTSGTTHFVKDKNKVDWHVVQTDCRWWLHLNYYYPYKEWQYKNIIPRIVIEEMLTDEDGNIPADYKLHCFNGKFEFLQIDFYCDETKRRNIYNKDWDLLPFEFSVLKKDNTVKVPNGKVLNRPNCLTQLIELAEKLAKPFPHVRVDFYVVRDEIFFGELTFNPEGGYGHFTPNKWDAYYGEKIPLIKFHPKDINNSSL